MFKNTIKPLVIGSILCVSILSFTPVFATVQQYILTKISYPILVNGEEYTNDELPVLNYNGSTFIPLRAVGDMLNTKVEWNEELKRVEIGKMSPIINSNKPLSASDNSYMDYNSYENIFIDLNGEGLYSSILNKSFLEDSNGIYTTVDNMTDILNIIAGNYTITDSDNKFLKGSLQSQSSSPLISLRYYNKNNDLHFLYKTEYEYITTNDKYLVGNIYNYHNEDKSYDFSLKKDTPINSFLIDDIPYVNINEVLECFSFNSSHFSIKRTNDTNNLILTFNTIL